MHNGDHADAKEETKNTTHITFKVFYGFFCRINRVRLTSDLGPVEH